MPAIESTIVRYGGTIALLIVVISGVIEGKADVVQDSVREVRGKYWGQNVLLAIYLNSLYPEHRTLEGASNEHQREKFERGFAAVFVMPR